jgi:hypothetical protein
MTTTQTARPQDALEAQYGKDIVRAAAQPFAWTKVDGWKTGCPLCEKVFEPRRGGNSLNFALTSHAQMHVRKGELLETYGARDGYKLMPSEADVLAQRDRRQAHQDAVAPLVELRAALVPLRNTYRLYRDEQHAQEQQLLTLARDHGAENTQFTAMERMGLIREWADKARRARQAIDALIATYPEIVRNGLIAGDFL